MPWRCSQLGLHPIVLTAYHSSFLRRIVIISGRATIATSHSDMGRASTQLRADRTPTRHPPCTKNVIPPNPHDEFQVTHRRLSPFAKDQKACPRVTDFWYVIQEIVPGFVWNQPRGMGSSDLGPFANWAHE